MKTLWRQELEETVDPVDRALLKLRAERLRKVVQVAREDSEALLSIAQFSVGGSLYAFPLSHLRASVTLRGVSPVPLAQADVVGIVRFEGQSVTVFSLAALLGESGWSQDPSVLIVVEPSPGSLMAVDCEQIPQLGTVLQAHVTAAQARATQEAVVPIATEGNRQLHLIDFAALMRRRGEARRE